MMRQLFNMNEAIRGAFMDCRTHKIREQIVTNNKVTPIAHVKLLNGQRKKSDAGGYLSDQYYQFKVEGRNEVQIIQCGMTAAKDFLNLTQHVALPLFNPLCGNIGPNKDRINNINKYVNGNISNKKIWDPMAKELYNAVMWLVVLLNGINIDTPLYKIKNDLETYYYSTPFDSKIRAVNTMIKHGLDDETLTNKIRELKQQNRIKDSVCDFHLLINKVKKMTDRNGRALNIICWF